MVHEEFTLMNDKIEVCWDFNQLANCVFRKVTKFCQFCNKHQVDPEVTTSATSTTAKLLVTEVTSILEELLNVTVPALEGNNSAAYDLKEMNDNVQRVMLGPHINYNEEEKTINAMVGAVRQLMSDPESQLMAAVAIGIGTLNNRLLLLMSTPARYLSTS